MPAITRRRTPEELLQQVQAEEAFERTGRLKVFLGYASGVGKSFRMLDEGRRRHERVERITGKKVSQTVPRSFLNAADEIVVVDAPPEMCIGRAGGDAPAQSSQAQKLSELREIALLLAADVVDRQLEAYLQRNGI